MEKKLVASIPLHRYQNIAVTPFAAWQENVGQRIFVINSDSMLEEFCHFLSPLRSGLRLSKVYWYLRYAEFGIAQTIPKLKLCRNF